MLLKETTMSARIEVLHAKVDKLQESVDLLANVMDNLCIQVQSQNVVLGDIENMIHTIYEGRDNG